MSRQSSLGRLPPNSGMVLLVLVAMPAGGHLSLPWTGDTSNQAENDRGTGESDAYRPDACPGVDEKDGRDTRHAVKPAYPTAGIEQDRKRELAAGALDVFAQTGSVHANRDQLKTEIGLALSDFAEVRQLFLPGVAPECPEVEHEDMALVILQAARISLNIEQTKGRRRAAIRQAIVITGKDRL